MVVDDASSDETAAICLTIPGIKYVRVDRNQGVAGARNLGLVASSGEYVTFLDDDDVRMPGSVDQQVRILDQMPGAMMIYAQAIPQDADGTQRQPYPRECPQGDIFWDLLIRNFIPSGSAVFDAPVLPKSDCSTIVFRELTIGTCGSASPRSFLSRQSKLRS